MTHLSFPLLSKLPNAAWDQHLPIIRHILGFAPIRLHSASPAHQSLVNHACPETQQLSGFLNTAILPSLQAKKEYNCNHEALLLHALDDLANDPDFTPTMPTCLPTDGVLQNVSRGTPWPQCACAHGSAPHHWTSLGHLCRRPGC
ncbi:TPA: hypothetical protein ACH3X1_012677 [Trebouxia sp. C0004]